jgi:hypothetical protein
LTPTTPSVISNVSPLSGFPTLEASWTRNTSYPKKYAVEGTISMEDIKCSDIDVYARTLLRLTRAIVKQVDLDIWNVISENQTAVNINAVTSTAAWDAASGQDPIEDILEALMDIENNGYNSNSAVIVLSPKDKKNLMTWLISSKGSAIPMFSSDLAKNGDLTGILGHRIITNVNVTADYALVCVPKVCATWKEQFPLSVATIENKGIGTTLRVYTAGITLLTDPKAVALISNTQA